MIKRATIVDVAKIANVSLMTVSRVIRNSSKVKADTRNKVIDAIAQLDYHPNFSARALSSRITGNIGFLFSRKKKFNDYISHLAFAIENTIHAQNYSLLACVQRENPAAVPIMISQKKIDGIVAVGHDVHENIIKACVLNKIPVVLIDGFSHSKQVTLIHADYRSCIRKMVAHLIAQGFTGFGYLGSHADDRNDERKHVNLAQVLQDFDLSLPEANILHTDKFKNNFAALFETCIENIPANSAYICENDHIAARLLDYLYEHDISVPEKVAVTSFGNTELAELKHPHITSIYVDMDELVNTAVKTVFEIIMNEQIQSNHIHITTQLIVRESSNRSVLTIN